MEITKEHCEKFMKDKTINPLTSRIIKKDGPTYKKLVKACEDNKTYNKNIMIQVVGLGCSKIKKDTLAQYEIENGKLVGMKCLMLCNKSLRKTLTDIAKTYCHMVPSKKDKFVVRVLDIVKHYANEGVNVHLFGYSYGGSIVSRVAELLDTNPLKNIHLYTCGSIYVSKPELTKNVDLTHYMFVNDVALKCNGLDRKEKKEDYVVWLRQKNYVTPEKKKTSIFGTDEEWLVHNSYNFERQIIKKIKLPVVVVQNK